MELSPKWRWAGTLLGAGALVLAIPGMIANFKAWRDASRTIPVQVPWPYLILAGLGILAIVWVPTLWRWQRGHRRKLSRAAEADAIEMKLAESQAKAAESQSVVDNLRSMLNDARKELAREREDKEAAEKAAFSYHCKLDYGEELPEYHSVTPSDVDVMILSLWEIQGPLDSLRANTDHFWNEVVSRAKMKGAETPTSWLADRIGVSEYANLYRMFETIRYALDNKWDPRRYVAAFYTCYCAWRSAMLKLLTMTGEGGLVTEKKEVWRAAEQKYFDRLQAKLAIPQFREVRRTVRAYDSTQGNVGLMPTLPV